MLLNWCDMQEHNIDLCYICVICEHTERQGSLRVIANVDNENSTNEVVLCRWYQAQR